MRRSREKPLLAGYSFSLKMPKIGVGRMTLNGEKNGDSPSEKIFFSSRPLPFKVAILFIIICFWKRWNEQKPTTV